MASASWRRSAIRQLGHIEPQSRPQTRIWAEFDRRESAQVGNPLKDETVARVGCAGVQVVCAAASQEGWDSGKICFRLQMGS